MEYPILLPSFTARALLQGDEAHPGLRGEVVFSPYVRGTLVIARVVGLPAPGFLGFHIHTGGSCIPGGDISFSSAGGHYTTHNVPHPWHSGDLPPLLASDQGSALLAVYTDRFQPGDVVGKTVVVHERADDFHSQPAGNSGSRLACGVIQAV